MSGDALRGTNRHDIDWQTVLYLKVNQPVNKDRRDLVSVIDVDGGAHVYAVRTFVLAHGKRGRRIAGADQLLKF